MARKFVVVLNKDYQADQLLSALGHVAIGLGANSPDRASMEFVHYRDADGNIYPNISAWPVIALRGNAGRIKRLRAELIHAGIDYACYLDTMISGGSDAQIEATESKNGEELTIMALATFAEVATIDPLTKRFSLWRGGG